MKIIDARSGQEMTIGQTISYTDGESVTLLEVEPGILQARARARTVHRDMTKLQSAGFGVIDMSKLPLITQEQWVPLTVRWTHPAFFLQHVAFFPS